MAYRDIDLGFGGNFRKTIIIGNNDAVSELKDFLTSKKSSAMKIERLFSLNLLMTLI